MRFLSLLLALQQVQVHRKRNPYASSLAFSSLKVLPVLHLGRSHPSPSLVFYLLLFLGFYSLYLIELVLSFSKSPSLLKSEFGRKSYHRFCKPCFLSVAVRRRRAVRRNFRRDFRHAELSAELVYRSVFRRPPNCSPGGPAAGPAAPNLPPNLSLTENGVYENGDNFCVRTLI